MILRSGSEREMSTDIAHRSKGLIHKCALRTALIYDHIGCIVPGFGRGIRASRWWILANLLGFLLFVDDAEVPLEFAPIFLGVYFCNIYHFLVLARVDFRYNF